MKIFLNASYSCDFKAEFLASLLQSNDPSEIILIFWFAAQKTFIISFVTLQMSLSSFDQFKASLLNKSINFCNFSPPNKKKDYTDSKWVAAENKQKLSNKKNMLLETGLLLKMQSDCLPVGGAVRAGVLAVSSVMAVI